jgi:two-component system nitrate/nitrite response regulator NarL
MNLVICDDHQVFADALAFVLTNEGFTVQKVAQTPKEAVSAVAALDVDVVLMDLRFPDGDGIDAASRIAEVRPTCKVVLLTGSYEPDAIAAALKAGVTGFVHKSEDVHAIARAIQRVADGEVSIDPPVLRRLVATAPTPSLGPAQRLASLLTQREREVLTLLVRGRSTQAIAAELGVSYSTARTHTQNVIEKLNVHSRLEAAAFAVANRLVLPEHQ